MYEQEEVATSRGLKTATVISHMCEALKAGMAVDLPRLGVTPDLERRITQTIRAPPISGGWCRVTYGKMPLFKFVYFGSFPPLLIALFPVRPSSNHSFYSSNALDILSLSLLPLMNLIFFKNALLHLDIYIGATLLV